jgi:hypothetical protein
MEVRGPFNSEGFTTGFSKFAYQDAKCAAQPLRGRTRLAAI